MRTALLIPALVVLSQRVSAQDGRELFRDRVRPLIVSKCLACHDADKKKGGLDLTRRARAVEGGDNGAALKPGSAKDSLLMQKLVGKEMPPKNPLTDEQLAFFRKWIDAGAPYDDEPLALRRAGLDWWSLKPVKKHPIPRLAAFEQRTANFIDSFVFAKLAEKGLSPAPEADRRTLVRRLTYDLTGLPPTPEEIESAVADARPDWYEQLVERLLASPAYGERWGRHWLDVVRFGESQGYEMNNPRFNAWPYRDYVIRAFNRDIPYPQFILEQLAGDTLASADALTQSATGFIVGGSHDMVLNAMTEGRLQQRMDDLDDMITATGSTFLGLTINCARCHDHKFDPLTQKDYYSLQAVFAGVQHGDRLVKAAVPGKAPGDVDRIRRDIARIERQLDAFEPPAQPDATEALRSAVNSTVNVDRFAPVEARFVRLTIFATSDKAQPCIDELEVWTVEEEPRNVALASVGAKVKTSSTLPGFVIHKTEHINDGRYGNSASWISNERGQGWIEIELARPARIDRVLWGRDRDQQFRDRLAINYTLETALEPGKWKTVASSQDRRRFKADAPPETVEDLKLPPAQEARYRDLVHRRAVLVKQLPSAAASLLSYSGTFVEPGRTHVLLRGDPTRRGDPVAPAAPAAVKPALNLDETTSEPQRRLALARWLGNSDNPLTARVMVNRLWQYHFGQGLVATSSDFGYNGEPPSHPELLDRLASEFVESGWSMKAIHRLIATSSTYRQNGRMDEKAAAIDRGNRLLWRMAPRRLEAEALRDGILSVSGRLDRRMEGAGFYMWERSTNYVTIYKPKQKLDPEDHRRMVYMMRVRSQQDAIFGVFDCPDAATARPKRTTSTTVLQTLNLLNGAFTLDQADLLAERLKREAGDDAGRQVERAFLLAFGRKPTNPEAEASLTLVRKHGTASLCRVLFNANEFLYID